MAAPVVTSGTQSVDSHSQFVSPSSGSNGSGQMGATVVKAEVGCMTSMNGTSSVILGNCVVSNNDANCNSVSGNDCSSSSNISENNLNNLLSNGTSPKVVVSGSGGVVGGCSNMLMASISASSTISLSTSTSTSPPPPLLGGFDIQVSPFLNGSSNSSLNTNLMNGNIVSSASTIGIGIQAQQQSLNTHSLVSRDYIIVL